MSDCEWRKLIAPFLFIVLKVVDANKRKTRYLMTTTEKVIELWKRLESATRLAFPTWDGHGMEKFLKSMQVEGLDFTRIMALRGVRNALAHGLELGGKPLVAINDAVVPFLEDAITLVQRLPTVANVWIPRSDVFVGSLGDNIHLIVEEMLRNVFSHIPVLDSDGKVLGVFSESTLLEMNNAGIMDDGSLTLSNVLEFLPCEVHKADVFRFVPKNDPIAHIRRICAEALARHERIGMFFATKNGKSDEPLLGILTVWDIAGVSDVSNMTHTDKH